MTSLREDLAYAARLLRREYGFTTAVALTLAVGVGLTTATFAILNGVLLRPLPVSEQERLLVLSAENRAQTSPHIGLPNGALWSLGQESRSFSDVAGVPAVGAASPLTVRDGERSISMAVTFASGNLFKTLGVRPLLGRTLEPDDDRSGTALALVLSYRAWRRDFGAQPDVVGRTVRLPMGGFTVVGVAPEGLDFPRGTDVWLATAQLLRHLGFEPGQEGGYWDLVGRLKPGVTLGQAAAEFSAFLHNYQSPRFGAPASRVAVVRRFTDVIVGDLRTGLLIVFAAVILLLLIACTNIAGLLLTRGLTRMSELAIRSALGADHKRLATQLLTENLVLGVAGGMLGLVVAAVALRACVTLAPPGLPRFDEIRFDLAALGFALALTCGSMLLFGVAPAFRTVRSAIGVLLRGSAYGAIDLVTGRIRQLLVVVQVALAVMELSSAGILVRSLAHLQHSDLGFKADQFLFVVVQALESGGSDMEAATTRHLAVLETLQERLPRTPGIVSATASYLLPFSVVGGTTGLDQQYRLEGQSTGDALKNPIVSVDVASESYFRTLGIPLLRGRVFTTADIAGAPDVAVVNETMARGAWPDQDPLGKRLQVLSFGTPGRTRSVVGVVRDTRYRDVRAVLPTVYVPLHQTSALPAVVAVRTVGDPQRTLPTVKSVLTSFDGGYTIGKAFSIEDLRSLALVRPRFLAAVLAVLACAAAVLAGVGLFSVLSFHVRHRSRELGVRMSLGASPSELRNFVLRRALRIGATGGVVGLLAALASTRVLRAFLFDISPTDPLTLAGVVVFLLALSGLAAYVPAMRASRLDPAAVLRAE